MANKNMANREVCDLIFVDYQTKKPFLNLDFANVTTTELTGESVYAYGGKGHPRRITFYGEKAGTMTIETQIQTVQLWQLITGGEVSNKYKFVKREVLEVGSNGTDVTLPATPVTGTVVVYAENDDCGIELANSVSGTTITLTSSLTAGDKVIVYYMVEVTSGVKNISIKSTTFPKAFTVYGDTVMKTEDDELLAYKLTAYKCSPQANLSLGFSNTGDPASLSITLDLLATQDGDMLDLALIED